MLKHYEPELRSGIALRHEIHQFHMHGICRSYWVRTFLDDSEITFQICWGKKELAQYLDKLATEIEVKHGR